MWALFLLIFNFQTMTWNYADIDGALIFNTIEECNMPMMKYNEIMQKDKYVFVCEPYVPVEIKEEPLERNGEEELNELLDQLNKDDTLNKPDTNGKHKKTTPNIFKNLGIPEPKGMDV